jgi:hypothetical protein
MRRHHFCVEPCALVPPSSRKAINGTPVQAQRTGGSPRMFNPLILSALSVDDHQVQATSRRTRRGVHADVMVEAVLDLVKHETERVDSGFLEPAFGSGNSLVQILRRKLAAVELKCGQSEFEKRHFALHGLMCIYGANCSPTNIIECWDNLLDIFAEYLGVEEADDLYRAASFVWALNLVHGDALTMLDSRSQPIVFVRTFDWCWVVFFSQPA